MIRSWWSALLVLMMLGWTLTGALAQENQGDQATPVTADAATPVAGINLPMIGFAPTESERGYFELTLEPGQSQTVSVRIANAGAEPIRLATYAADIYTRINGGAESRLLGEPVSGATNWLTYPSETLDLQPAEEITRDITVSVPAGTAPGEYISSVVVQNLDPIAEAAGEGVGILQVLRQAIAVTITVPGPRQPALEIKDATYLLSPAYAAVLVSVENTGNVRLQPAATMTLTAADGTDITNAALQMETFFPGTRADLEFQLVRTLEPGDYTIALSLEDTAEQVKVEVPALPLTVEAPVGTPVAETAINISAVAINEARDAAGALQVVEAVVTIDNPGMQIDNARLTLRVTRDGELVEDLVLGSSLTFPAGTAEFRQRYFPMSGWTPGEYTFTVILDSIDPNNNQPVELDTLDAPITVTVK